MRGKYVIAAASLAWLAAHTAPCAAFYINGTWTTTASGPVAPAGNAATLTWSIVPDGTSLSIGGTSNLISFLDAQFGAGPGGADLSQRPWFSVVNSAFARWTELGGLTFEYARLGVGDSHLADDGVPHGSNPGLLGVRGDVRLGGKFLDGVSGSNASAGFVPDADITLETGDPTFFYNPASDPTFLNFRNTLAHEVGHSLGLAHMGNSIFLMYPFSSSAYDGPQFDDIRGLHQQYGDIREKSGGNNLLTTATPLGTIDAGQTLTLGADGTTGTKVEPTESDFLSISNASDLDYFRFSITSPAWVDATATPVGPAYGQRPNPSGSFTTINSVAASNLSLELYALVGASWELLATASGNPIGLAESLLDMALDAGDYAVKIAGSTAVVQTYQLQLAVESRIPGDFDHNNRVDGNDFLVWQQGLGVSRSAVELHDFRTHFGEMAQQTGAVSLVPEPTTGLGASCMVVAALGAGRRRRCGYPPCPARVTAVFLNAPQGDFILGSPLQAIAVALPSRYRSRRLPS